MSLITHQSIAHIVVGVADMRPVRELWLQRFGLEVCAERGGSDPELERLWNLPVSAVAEQMLVRTPGAECGGIHFVRFSQPADSVRANAAPTDLGPKNIDVNCTDIFGCRDQLLAAGFEFRSAVSEYEIESIAVREVQMPAHDDINVVLIEVPGWPIDLSPRGYGAATSCVVVVPDIAAESAFYTAVLGLERVMQHRAAGAAIEQVIGLPPGAALLLELLGSANQLFGRVELIHYEDLPGADRFARSAMPVRGFAGARFQTHDLEAFAAHCSAAGIACAVRGPFDLLFGRVRIARLTSPAGFRLDVYELTDQAAGGP